MKKILLILIITLLTIATTNANSLDFYGEKDNLWGLGKVQISELEGRINLLQDRTGLNTDIVILGKGDKYGCYNVSNFDSCVKNKYGYTSDIIIVLKMKSNISSRGDIRSYMDNKNYPIVTTDILKNIQDSIIYNFKNNDFRRGLLEYYSKLEKKYLNKCSELLKYNKNNGGSLYKNKCRISDLKAVYNENELLKTNAQKSASLIRNIYIGISIFIFTLFMIVMHVYYLGRLKKVFKDIKFQLIDLDEGKTFKKDTEKTRKELEKLIKKMEIYLANADKIWIKLRKYYKEVSKKADDIKNEYNKSVENFNKQEQLEKEIEDFKNINI